MYVKCFCSTRRKRQRRDENL